MKPAPGAPAPDAFSLPDRVLARPKNPRQRNDMESQKQTRQTIIRLLSSMASAKEISQYVKR
ncbi:MAG: hypothetical protein EOP91_04025, partial [Lysobacteraceae bacterium]